jgi:hypothetical protein
LFPFVQNLSLAEHFVPKLNLSGGIDWSGGRWLRCSRG